MKRLLIFAAIGMLSLSGCSRAARPPAQSVIAIEGFLADIAQQVAGDRIKVGTLIPPGIDPHSYEPTPRDIATVEKASLLIINGAGLEAFLERLLSSTESGTRRIVEASRGLQGRDAREGEAAVGHQGAHETDPHFWLAPVLVITYVENIQAGMAELDPAGAEIYRRNATAYIAKLRELDAWISLEVSRIPPAQRMLVTNHESFGYFADRYGFRIIGTIIPSVSSGSEPTARELARLSDGMKKSGIRAIFLETGSDSRLARQIADEAGVRTVTTLFTHSLTDRQGPAPSYIEMMRANARAIVTALAGSSAGEGAQ